MAGLKSKGNNVSLQIMKLAHCLLFGFCYLISTNGAKTEKDYVRRLSAIKGSRECTYHLTGSNDTITSPGYPFFYPSNVKCRWLIETTPGWQILAHLVDLRIEPSKNCEFDSVSIYDGKDESAALIRHFCGETPPEYLRSTGRFMTITMKSDQSESLQGFKLKYNAVAGCIEKFTAPTGYIETPNYPEKYPSNLNCKYSIPLQVGKSVELRFDDFELEGLMYGECFDYLSIHEVSFESSTSIGRFCGTKFPMRICISSKDALLQFVTDQALNFKGFRLKYTITDGNCTYTSENEMKGSPSKTIKEPGVKGDPGLKEQLLKLEAKLKALLNNTNVDKIPAIENNNQQPKTTIVTPFAKHISDLFSRSKTIPDSVTAKHVVTKFQRKPYTKDTWRTKDVLPPQVMTEETKNSHYIVASQHHVTTSILFMVSSTSAAHLKPPKLRESYIERSTSSFLSTSPIPSIPSKEKSLSVTPTSTHKQIQTILDSRLKTMQTCQGCFSNEIQQKDKEKLVTKHKLLHTQSLSSSSFAIESKNIHIIQQTSTSLIAPRLHKTSRIPYDSSSISPSVYNTVSTSNNTKPSNIVQPLIKPSDADDHSKVNNLRNLASSRKGATTRQTSKHHRIKQVSSSLKHSSEYDDRMQHASKRQDKMYNEIKSSLFTPSSLISKSVAAKYSKTETLSLKSNCNKSRGMTLLSSGQMLFAQIRSSVKVIASNVIHSSQRSLKYTPASGETIILSPTPSASIKKDYKVRSTHEGFQFTHPTGRLVLTSSKQSTVTPVVSKSVSTAFPLISKSATNKLLKTKVRSVKMSKLNRVSVLSSIQAWSNPLLHASSPLHSIQSSPNIFHTPTTRKKFVSSPKPTLSTEGSHNAASKDKEFNFISPTRKLASTSSKQVKDTPLSFKSAGDHRYKLIKTTPLFSMKAGSVPKKQSESPTLEFKATTKPFNSLAAEFIWSFM